MEIISSQDQTQLKVVKTLEEEIASCQDPELKKELEDGCSRSTFWR